jgi:hypothetical protein
LGVYLISKTINHHKEVSMTNKKTTQKSTGFTDEERAAMKERARELKAEARANKNKAQG